MGPAILLVDGLSALCPPKEGEEEDAIAKELQETKHSIVVLLTTASKKEV